MKKLRITIGEKIYDVTVETLDEGAEEPASGRTAHPADAAPVSATSLHAPSPAAAASGAAPSAADPDDLVSPLAGILVAVAPKVGDTVKEGDQLVTIEAMKMNTFVFAHKSGKVSEILATVGEAVHEGQPLIRIQ